MRTMSSSEFRKRYATLTEPVAVTVNGHIIGRWSPGAAEAASIETRVMATTGLGARLSQKERDAILRRLPTSRKP